jgi:hypothetical protein
MKADQELVELAEKHRRFLPKDFLRDVDAVAADLAADRSIELMRTKGQSARRSSNVRIRSAILEELSLFLCTEDPRYASVRGEGKKVTKSVVQFVAGVIVGSLGLASGAATGCVAFLALACAHVGIGAFCRLNPPPGSAMKSLALKRKETR